MSETIREITENPVPSILTTSFRKILPFYNTKIIVLKAMGGEFPSKSIKLEPDYGVFYNPGRSGKIEINYEQKRAEDGTILNPLNNKMIERILKHLDNNLPPYKGNKPDIPISFLVVEIQDKQISELLEIETDVFDATFISDLPEPNMKKRMYYPKSEYFEEELGDHWKLLAKGFGFKLRNLNLREFGETTQKFTKPKNQWKFIIQWKGWLSGDVPKSPIAVSGRIRDKHLLPEPFGRLKTYVLTSTNKLELDGVR